MSYPANLMNAAEFPLLWSLPWTLSAIAWISAGIVSDQRVSKQALARGEVPEMSTSATVFFVLGALCLLVAFARGV